MKRKRLLLLRNLWRLGMVLVARLICLFWRGKRVYVETDRTPGFAPEVIFVGIQSGAREGRNLHLNLRISGQPWFFDPAGRDLGAE